MDRRFALPQTVGVYVKLRGRVLECANLLEPAGCLLDIGCSSGWVAGIAAGRGVVKYVGIDREILGKTSEVAGAKFVAGSALALPFDDHSFDAACLFDVIEHLPKGSESQAIREAVRVLRPHGRLYLSTPHANWLYNPLDPLWLLGHRHYTRSTVGRFLESADLRIERLFVAGGVIEALDYALHLICKHLLRSSSGGIPLATHAINRAHGWDHRLGMTVFAVASRS